MKSKVEIISTLSSFKSDVAFNGYQNFDYQTYLKQCIDKGIRTLLKGIRTHYIVARFDDGITVIAPLQYDAKTVQFMGDGGPTGEFDFLYSTKATEKHILKMIEIIKKVHFEKNIILGGVREESLTDMALKRKYEYTSRLAFNIPVPADYDTWFSSLSKNTRQNIRTAHNRLKKDGQEYTFEILKGDTVSRKDFWTVCKLYRTRSMEWSFQYQGSDLKYWIKVVHDYMKGITQRSLFKVKESALYTIKINGRMVAFMIAYLYNGRLLVPRLAINSKYGKYSPGGLLLQETVKYYTARLGSFDLDLGRGEEKYKSTYGGELYRINRFFIN